jgi:hypothetical protein
MRVGIATDLVETCLGAEFSPADRHLRRLGKVVLMETTAGSEPPPQTATARRTRKRT